MEFRPTAREVLGWSLGLQLYSYLPVSYSPSCLQTDMAHSEEGVH